MSIEIKNVTKHFKNVIALDNVNLLLEDEKIYGLFGRNGSGKSTLLNIISNRIPEFDGEVYINENKLDGKCELIGKMFVMSDLMLYPEGMKVKEAFKWTGEFYDSFDMKYALELADKFKLELNRRVDKLSTGYTSILKLIIALAVNTAYVFYDEPILGLDANHRELFYRELIANYSDKPKTIVISTHLIDEIASVIEHVFILNNGKIIIDSDVDTLLENGYTITGNGKDVDEFIKGKRVLGTDSLGLYKSAYIYERINRDEIPNNLEISKLDLQKLFVEITNC